jgi:uracil phosphoribosyltransferase
MNEEVEILTIDDRVSVVVTTKPDLKEFGHAIADVLAPCELGYMSFQGRRGLDALTGPVREMELPDLGGEKVSLLVIAKSTLATGCTAVSLTQTAVRQYSPNAVVIASIFHSVRGLQELTREFPGANIYVVGDPDRLGVDGMLYPGVGMLELRMTALE